MVDYGAQTAQPLGYVRHIDRPLANKHSIDTRQPGKVEGDLIYSAVGRTVDTQLGLEGVDKLVELDLFDAYLF